MSGENSIESLNMIEIIRRSALLFESNVDFVVVTNTIKAWLKNSVDAARKDQSSPVLLNEHDQVLSSLDIDEYTYMSQLLENYNAQPQRVLTDHEKYILERYEGDLLINKCGRGNTTLLIEAIKAKRCDIANWLVQSEGAEIDLIRGEVPLLVACKIGQIEMIKMLVENGANVNLSLYALGKQASPLSEAIENGHHECVTFLREQGAKEKFDHVFDDNKIKRSIAAIERLSTRIKPKETIRVSSLNTQSLSPLILQGQFSPRNGANEKLKVSDLEHPIVQRKACTLL